jgi:hypothetical protein
LPETAAHQGDDFLLNLRIVQKAQKRLFEGLVSLGLLDLVVSFGSILHRTMMPQASSVERPGAVMAQKSGQKTGVGLGHRYLVSEDPQCQRQKSVRTAICALLVSFDTLIFHSLEISARWGCARTWHKGEISR